MAEISTTIFDFAKLPSEITDWVKPRLAKDETVQLSIVRDLDDKHQFYGFYFLTNQKLLLLDTYFTEKNRVHYYSSHKILFLGDVYKINISSEPDPSESSTGVVSRHIELICNGGYYALDLDPKTANVFETILWSLLWSIKPHA